MSIIRIRSKYPISLENKEWMSYLSPISIRQIHDLLWSSGTFDRSVGERKDSVSLFGWLNSRKCFGDSIHWIVGTNTRRFECFGQSFDFVPIDVNTGGHQQIVIFDETTGATQSDLIAFGIDGHALLFDPLNLFRHNLSHGSTRVRQFLDSSANQSPHRLIVVSLRLWNKGFRLVCDKISIAITDITRFDDCHFAFVQNGQHFSEFRGYR